MLTAKNNSIAEKLFSLYNHNLLRRRFNSLSIKGLSAIRNRNSEMPLIIYLNHSSWWDGLVAFELSRILRLNCLIMMEEKHLKKMPFFRRLGAFSVDTENAKMALQSIDYSVNLLKGNKQNTLWIFPQGEILPNDARPLKFYSGLARIIRHLPEIQIAPIAMRFEFLGEHKPDIFIKAGLLQQLQPGKDFNVRAATLKMSQSLTDTLDSLKTDIINRNLSGFDKFL